jgi:hypothetical protein
MNNKKIVYESKQTKAGKKLDKLADSLEKPLLSVSSVFPFTIFPDSIVVDKKKVDIIHRDFFQSRRVFTIFIEDIRTVRVSNSLLFATVSFEVKGFEQNPQPVRFVRKEEASRLRCLIIGLCTSEIEDISLDKVPVKKARKKLTKIGKLLRRRKKI